MNMLNQTFSTRDTFSGNFNSNSKYDVRGRLRTIGRTIHAVHTDRRKITTTGQHGLLQMQHLLVARINATEKTK